MASAACELVYVALHRYCSLLEVGRLELIDDLLGEVLNGTTQRAVLAHLLPVSTKRPLYRTSNPMPNLVNLTLHPSLHSFTTDYKE